ncbi:MAG: hypothetical protein U9Q71_10175, partial [Pseudomonadota bacterium]|nr:hypothetical protein [Pseudomonadota bacterium]
EPAPDVHEWAPPPESAASLQPLARVFDTYWSNGLSYRNHRIPAVAGTTEANELEKTLGAEFHALQPSDRGWLFFIGHGAYSEDLNNRINLWNGTGFTVQELKELLDQVPSQTRLRFLFAQCYAGAFADLAAPETNRCSFLAQAADKESEGCSAAVEKKDYEDYSTYFFAALTGHPRNHAGLDGRPDRNNDGFVTPLEAHFHVLATAYSADIPRATSEVLLMQWQPKNLSDLSARVSDAENEYTAMAREVMHRVKIDPGGDPAMEIDRRQSRLEEQWEQLEKNHKKLLNDISSLQEMLKIEVVRRWPRAEPAYTLNFVRFLSENINKAQELIQAHPGYSELRRLQDQSWQHSDQALEILRAHTQLEKISHLLRLSLLKAALEDHGPEKLLERYRALRKCESAPF